ncbi:hypothetical protein Tco_1301487 [Tanacetum coccineum]
MGFGDKWCKWVDSCLRSSSISILVNGSPLEEFGLERDAKGLIAIVKRGWRKAYLEALRLPMEATAPPWFVHASAPGQNMRRAKNLALLGKWLWRFRKEGDSLWVRVVTSIHEDCGCSDDIRARGGVVEDWVWGDIVKIGEEINGLRIDFTSSCVGILGDGGILDFGTRRLACWKESFRTIIGGCGNGNGNGIGDRWRWPLGEDGEFTVKELTRFIMDKILLLDNGDQESLWNKLVLKKVNIFLSIDLKGKRAFIAAVAGDNRYGWAIAKYLVAAGAEILVGTWVPVSPLGSRAAKAIGFIDTLIGYLYVNAPQKKELFAVVQGFVEDKHPELSEKGCALASDLGLP